MQKRKPTRAERGDATRARILDAARQRFAADGYERATIRAIAADAGIDPSLVMRYYGNKQGLFVAAADFDLRLSDLRNVPRAKAGASVVAHFLKRWGQDDILLALLRSAATNEQAAKRMTEAWAAQAVPIVIALGVDRASAPTAAALIDSLFFGFAYSCYILKAPPLASMDHDEIVQRLGPVVQRYLYGKS